ncbi:hypothetical protein MPLB_2110005 [Mesorhizobium sp. ORS 3324]|nr:hypothetical protein MPLB_2110005 [Mesorhizobium sp. ORS 3324]
MVLVVANEDSAGMAMTAYRIEFKALDPIRLHNSQRVLTLHIKGRILGAAPWAVCHKQRHAGLVPGCFPEATSAGIGLPLQLFQHHLRRGSLLSRFIGLGAYMGTKKARQFCPEEKRIVLGEKQTPNHISHLLLSIATSGVWVADLVACRHVRRWSL